MLCLYANCKHEIKRIGGCVGAKMEGHYSEPLAYAKVFQEKLYGLKSNYTQPEEEVCRYRKIKWLLRESK